MRGLFLTGTDTGVGKTTVGRGLLRAAAIRGLRMVPFKPAETGCAPEPQDAQALWNAAGRPGPAAAVCLHAFAPPVAPAAAAEQIGLTISATAIAERAAQLSAGADAILVEGAGGLLVPYAPGLTTADIAGQLSLPLVVVARAGLGTINHTALTIREIQRRSLPLAALLLVETGETPPSAAQQNARWIAELTGLAPPPTLPYLGAAPTDDTLAAALAKTLDLDALFRTALAAG